MVGEGSKLEEIKAKVKVVMRTLFGPPPQVPTWDDVVSSAGLSAGFVPGSYVAGQNTAPGTFLVSPETTDIEMLEQSGQGASFPVRPWRSLAIPLFLPGGLGQPMSVQIATTALVEVSMIVWRVRRA